MSVSSIIGKLFTNNRNNEIYGELIGKSSKSGIKAYKRSKINGSIITSFNRDGSLLKIISKDCFSEECIYNKTEGHQTVVKNFKNNTATSIETKVKTLLANHTSWLGRGFGFGADVKIHTLCKYKFNPEDSSTVLVDSKQLYNKLNDKSWVYKVHSRPLLGITKRVTEWNTKFRNTIETSFELNNFKTPSGKAVKNGTIGREKGILYPHTNEAESINKDYQICSKPNRIEIKQI